jgi:ATP-dependent DNA helicase RecG
MAITLKKLSQDDARKMLQRGESHFWDFKSAQVAPAKLQRTVVGFLNADGGEIAVGIEDPAAGTAIKDRWKGFATQELANAHIQSLTMDIKPPPPLEFTFVETDVKSAQGLVLQIKVHKSENVHKTSSGDCYVRKNAQNLPLRDEQEIQNLRLSKGLISFEDQAVGGYTAKELEKEGELANFLRTYSPQTAAAEFLRRERLTRNDGSGTQPTYGAVLLYSELPASVLPKKCSVKITRYTTREAVPAREHLGAQFTVEGALLPLINDAVAKIKEVVESVKILTPDGLGRVCLRR